MEKFAITDVCRYFYALDFQKVSKNRFGDEANNKYIHVYCFHFFLIFNQRFQNSSGENFKVLPTGKIDILYIYSIIVCQKLFKEAYVCISCLLAK